MDTNNWRPTQGTEAPMDTSDWRTQLQPDSRQRIVNKIMETLKRHIPFSGQEGLDELRNIAQRFEENIYTAATSQPDYLRKISLKMITMETKSHNNMNNPMPSNPGGPSSQPTEAGLLQPRVQNPGQSHPIPLPNLPQLRQQRLIGQQNNLTNLQQHQQQQHGSQDLDLNRKIADLTIFPAENDLTPAGSDLSKIVQDRRGNSQDRAIV